MSGMNEGKQTIVFMVGPDMTGKTEIASALSRRIGVPRFKASSEHDSFLSSRTSKNDKFLNQIRYADPRVFDVLKQTGYSLIFDRGFPCEAAYSEVFKRTTDHSVLKHMDEQWASLGSLIVFCHRSSYAGIVDDIDPTIREETLQRIHDAYLGYLSKTKCRVLMLNVDDENLDREVNEIIESLNNYA